MVTEGDLVKDYKEVARMYTEGRPKNKEEAFSLMRRRLAEFGADAVIKVREKKNKNYEGIVVLFDESYIFGFLESFFRTWLATSFLGNHFSNRLRSLVAARFFHS